MRSDEAMQRVMADLLDGLTAVDEGEEEVTSWEVDFLENTLGLLRHGVTLSFRQEQQARRLIDKYTSREVEGDVADRED